MLRQAQLWRTRKKLKCTDCHSVCACQKGSKLHALVLFSFLWVLFKPITFSCRSH
nr:MAG TPA: hypothetical protein [Caudoviricetes sp.]